MHGWSALRLRLWWERAFWVLPTVGVLLGLVVEIAVHALDIMVPPDALSGVTAGAATQVLAAIGGGMVTFTGLVFSFVVLVLQFGSSQYSPRTVAYFLRARSTQVILATFLFTITFTFLSLLNVGREHAPELAVLCSVVLLLVSLVAFIVLLHSVGRRIRVDAVLSALGRQACTQFERRLGDTAHLSATKDSDPAAEREIAMTVRHTGRTGQVVAVDGARLLRIARRHRLTLDVRARVGDGFSRGSVLLECSPTAGDTATALLEAGPTGALVRRLARCVVVDVERSLPLDPMYSLRLLVDVAMRALSPGINDPTTAVRALDEIEQVLRTAAALPLGTRTLTDGPGRVTLSGPDWSDVVELALLEVLTVGAGQPQITRRLAALLDDVAPDVPVERTAILTAFRERLLTAAADGGEIALVPDRQGLGGARHPAGADTPATAGDRPAPAAPPASPVP
ncbi:MAG: DUF2254 domain-containing protein [Cellulomonas sp.]|nr:DUF2254 domain-containing protein [Cellulomonas sp.]